MTDQRLSAEQARRIVELVGACEIQRRDWDIGGLTRIEASRLIVALDDELGRLLRREKNVRRSPLHAPLLKPEKKIRNQRSVADTRRRMLHKLQADPNHPKHGGGYAYQCGCRCDSCVAGQAARYQRWKYGR